MRQIVVLAGGLATRLYPITKTISKSMIEVAGEPFIAHQLRICKKNGVEEVVLCVGHLSQQIKDFVGNGKKFGLNVIYSQEDEKLDTGGAIKNASKYLDDVFFTIYGDSYLRQNLNDVAKFYESQSHLGGVSKNFGLMTVWKNNNQIEPSRILVDGIHVKKYQKDPPPQGAQHAEYGLNILPKSIINKIEADIFPISRYFDILSAKKQLLSYEVSERFYEIGGFEGLKDTEKMFKKLLNGKN